MALGRPKTTCSSMVRDTFSVYDCLFSARRVVCVWDFKPCLRESIENSDGSFLLRDDSTCFDSEKGHDLHSVIQERNLMDCNASKVNKWIVV